MKRNQDRPLNKLREISLEININIHAEVQYWFHLVTLK